MRAIGFFSEVYGGDGPAAIESVNPPYPWQAAIADYLDSGTVVVWSPELVDDPLVPGESAGFRCVRTDGEWLWPGELSHFVRRHGIQVSEEFVQRMRANDWIAPTPSPAALEEAKEWVELGNSAAGNFPDSDPLS